MDISTCNTKSIILRTFKHQVSVRIYPSMTLNQRRAPTGIYTNMNQTVSPIASPTLSKSCKNSKAAFPPLHSYRNENEKVSVDTG